MTWPPGFIVTQVSTGLLVILGIVALVAKPRTRLSRSFGLLGIGVGAGIFALNLVIPRAGLEPEWRWALAATAAFIPALFGVWGVATSEGRVPPRERRHFVLGGVAVLTCAASTMVATLLDPSLAGFRERPVEAAVALFAVVLQLVAYNAGFLVLAFLCAVRYGRTAPLEHGQRTRLALMAAGLGSMSAFVAGYGVGGSLSLFSNVFGSSYLVLAVAVAAAWIVAGAGVSAVRPARRVAWTILGAALAGMAARSAIPLGMSADDAGVYGIARLVGFALLGYAIFRHQMLGLDVKVRFVISKSTLAAAFIAVFFVAGEVAQQFFGDVLGSQYIGILVAGAFIFAIAPLSRLADRLAERAVPSVVPKGPSDPSREHVFRSAVRLAMRDRRLTRGEERELFRLARELDITPERAHDVLAQVEEQEEKAGG